MATNHDAIRLHWHFMDLAKKRQARHVYGALVRQPLFHHGVYQALHNVIPLRSSMPAQLKNSGHTIPYLGWTTMCFQRIRIAGIEKDSCLTPLDFGRGLEPPQIAHNAVIGSRRRPHKVAPVLFMLCPGKAVPPADSVVTH